MRLRFDIAAKSRKKRKNKISGYPMLEIKKAKNEDWDQIWPIVQEVFRSGATYAYPPETKTEKAYEIWMTAPTATYAALFDGEVAGTYYIKPNQPGLGSHVCNAGYMVSSTARGHGIGRAMCAHSLQEAVKLGFTAMQYNLVVVTNQNAIMLWQDMGFEIIGTLPRAFNHKELGLVDAHVMYQLLI
jgi:ribosomal protein S18 acetylase RimI-like enzyme